MPKQWTLSKKKNKNIFFKKKHEHMGFKQTNLKNNRNNGTHMPTQWIVTKKSFNNIITKNYTKTRVFDKAAFKGFR